MTPEQMLVSTEMESHSPLTPLIVAAMTGNLGIAEVLIEKCPKLAEIPSRLGRVIPVIRAANAGHKEMTRFLYHRTSLPFLLSGKGFWLSISLTMPSLTDFLILPHISLKCAHVWL